MQTVVETQAYLRDARDAGLSEPERIAIVGWLSVHPDAGDEIKNTGGARKVRFAGKGKGKSGGYRVITFYSGPDIPVFLLNIFAKGEKVNLTQSERNELRDVLSELRKSYRKRRK
ncbi:MAG TPA: type II toxin-antitoxin system RelE/ParE family toxin [Alphaproteobacteria bacterium]|nr:type II toxin-antitoxin system RelE/ParE family toxin [Alphaproteobacteria bacterium]